MLSPKAGKHFLPLCRIPVTTNQVKRLITEPLPGLTEGSSVASSPTAELGPTTTESHRLPKGMHASTTPQGGNYSMWVKSWCCVALFPLFCLWDWDTPDSVLGRWSSIPPDAVPGGQAPSLLHLSDGSLHRVLGSFLCSELNSKSNFTYTRFCLMRLTKRVCNVLF